MVEANDARISDETLIGRVTAGDLSAFQRLVKRHQAAVYNFARAASPADIEPEEILHETFLAARRSAARYRYEPSARPWLLVLARQAIDRRYPRHDTDSTPLRELVGAAASGPGWDGASGRGALDLALAALPPGDREILTLCDRELFTVEEAARVTGMPKAVVLTRLHRARLRLLAELKESGRER